jgi:exopolysaccharide biosynthesis polyprenyl glycosylphosphotransferase
MRLLSPRTEEVSFPEQAFPAAGLAGRLFFPVAFALADSVGLLVAATVSHWLPGTANEPGWQGFLPGVRFAFPLTFWTASIACLAAFGFYDRLGTAFRKRELLELYRALTISVVVTMAITLTIAGESSRPVTYMFTWAVAPPAVAAGRGLVRWLRRQTIPVSMSAVPVLIWGEADTVERLIRQIESVPELDLAPIVSSSAQPEETRFTLDAIPRLAQQYGATHLVVAPRPEDEGHVLKLAPYLQKAGLRVYWLHTTAASVLRASSLHLWEGAAVIQVVGLETKQFYESAKRLLDLVSSAVLVTILLPLLGIIALAIKIESPGPVTIRQTRLGRGGRLFRMYKFRSMKIGSEEIPEELRRQNEATGPIFKMRRDPRITRIGRWLRRTSLDEVPQLFNVLIGDMSLVGPRPPLPREIPGYDEVQLRRLTVTPGITGLWQVSGRSTLTFDQMLGLDLEYIERRSLALDLLILARTLPCVISGKGAC